MLLFSAIICTCTVFVVSDFRLFCSVLKTAENLSFSWFRHPVFWQNHGS
ncbi:conserved hypothetical protein [Roseibium sp. TrichSKD4]|nr:conserved hypothetical protein [Roseibium sp. TrichSKD4]